MLVVLLVLVIVKPFGRRGNDVVANPDVVPASNPVSVNAPAQGSDPLLASNTDDGEAAPEYDELLTLLSGVLPSVGQAVLAEIDARYPSREAYLEAEYGLDEERLVQLRSRYVE